jgi:Zn-dependent metalloprotease
MKLLFSATFASLGLLGSLVGSLAHGSSLWSPALQIEKAEFASRELKGLRQLRTEERLSRLLQKEGASLRLKSEASAFGVQTQRFQHFFQGIEVMGSQALAHMGRSGAFVTNATLEFDLDTTPTFSRATAVSIARAYLGENEQLDGVAQLKILPSKDRSSAELVYFVRGKRTGMGKTHDYLINAHSGALISELPREIEIAPIDVYDAVNMPSEDIDPWSGAPTDVRLETLDPVIVKGVKSGREDASAQRAYEWSKKVLNYYKDTFNRDSYDGKGSPLVQIVHIGKNFANAFWTSDLKLMAYGDGDGEMLKDLTHALDVAGHEMTHGVVSETADLIYRSDSGALNEGFADVLGSFIEGKNDWIMGEDVFVQPKHAANGVRNLKNPGALKFPYRDPATGATVQRAYPATMAEKIPDPANCSRNNDYCWVHINSTIIGHLAMKLTETLGQPLTEKMFYVSLTQFLTQTSTFADFSSAMRKACDQVGSSTQCAQADEVLKSVGL